MRKNFLRATTATITTMIIIIIIIIIIAITLHCKQKSYMNLSVDYSSGLLLLLRSFDHMAFDVVSRIIE